MYSYDEARAASLKYFGGNELSTSVFLDKYALRNLEGGYIESTPDQMHERIAKEIARIEAGKFKQPLSSESIFDYIRYFERLIPQGSILAGCGNPYQIMSLANCFVVGGENHAFDSYPGIHLIDSYLSSIFARRGGCGIDISFLRPEGCEVQNAARTTTGAISFLERFSRTCREVAMRGRRAALMVTMSVHHPEIVNFAKSKIDLTKVTGANISVRLSDEFMEAVMKDKQYEQRFPVDSRFPTYSCMVSAREVWNEIVTAAHAVADPGILFWDNIIKESPASCYSKYKEITTNPCGELPLGHGDACRLFAINLTYYVHNKYSKKAYFDYEHLFADAQVAQRFIEDIVDLEAECIQRIINKVKSDPEPDFVKGNTLNLWEDILDRCVNGRRTGTGITALGDSLAMLGIKYGSDESVKVTEEIYKVLKLGAYKSSVDMAKELGPFPDWDKTKESENPFLKRIAETSTSFYDGTILYRDMQIYGRRNINLLTTAPTGTISILASFEVNGKRYFNTTSGIEPLFLESFKRRKKGNPGDENFRTDFIDQTGDSWMEFDVYHEPIYAWQAVNPNKLMEDNPYHGACANDINWANRITLQGRANRHIDNSISSTINLPEDITVEEVKTIYEQAWKDNLKGITIYRDKCRSGVLVNKDSKQLEFKRTTAPKRPKTLECDVYHVTVKGVPYFVLLGLLDGYPYEVFAGQNPKNTVHKSITRGHITKKARGKYHAVFDDGSELLPISVFSSPEEEVITRLVSTALRHGTDLHFLVDQLEKTDGDMQLFSKSIARALKRKIKDGTKVFGQECPTCSATLVRESGCLVCKACGWSKCS